MTLLNRHDNKKINSYYILWSLVPACHKYFPAKLYPWIAKDEKNNIF
jgi:hypothetical protein